MNLFRKAALFLWIMLIVQLTGLAKDTLQPGEFHSLRASREVQILVQKGDEEKVIIKDMEGIDNDDLEIKTEEKTLRIRTSLGLFDKGIARIIVIYKQMKSIEAIAGAKIISEKPISSKHLKFQVNSGSILSLKVEADSISGKVSSGGLLELNGKTSSQHIEVNAGSTYSGFGLESSRAIVFASTGGKAKVNVSQTIKAKAKAGGFINITGKPEKEKLNTKLGGEIIKNDKNTDE